MDGVESRRDATDFWQHVLHDGVCGGKDSVGGQLVYRHDSMGMGAKGGTARAHCTPLYCDNN